LPHILNHLQNDKTISDCDLATIHVTYMKVCVELEVPVSDAPTREIVARLIVKLYRRGVVDDLLKCFALARSRLEAEP
jgi:hypothetical protein